MTSVDESTRSIVSSGKKEAMVLKRHSSDVERKKFDRPVSGECGGSCRRLSELIKVNWTDIIAMVESRRWTNRHDECDTIPYTDFIQICNFLYVFAFSRHRFGAENMWIELTWLCVMMTNNDCVESHGVTTTTTTTNVALQRSTCSTHEFA